MSKSHSKIHWGFGTRAVPVPNVLSTVWERRPQWKQTHGVRIAEATAPRVDLGECDALWTRLPDVPVAVQTADCVPILLSVKKRIQGPQEIIAVAAIHAGWRGVLARILPLTVQTLKTELGPALEFEAFLGPAIGPCCFQVKADVREPFLSTFCHLNRELVFPREDRIDLHAIVLAELEALDIHEVTDAFRCTFCSGCSGSPHFLYNSYRRDKGLDRANIRQFSGIFMTN